MVEWLPSTHKALHSVPRILLKKKKKQNTGTVVEVRKAEVGGKHRLRPGKGCSWASGGAAILTNLRPCIPSPTQEAVKR